jgi:ATP-dependent DNA helicase RecG
MTENNNARNFPGRTENERLEFKASFGEWKEIIKTLCGFANKSGGTVIVGFDNEGNPCSLKIGKKTIEDFVNKIKNNTDPVLYPSIDIKTFALGNIVEIEVHKINTKKHINSKYVP